MTTDQPYIAPAAAPARRRLDVFGLVAVIVAGVILVPTALVLLIGLIPEMNAIWWLGLVLIPLCTVAGVTALVLSIVGLVIGARRGRVAVLSAVGAVLGVLCLVPPLWLLLGSGG
jgi:hypothetical protein